MTQIEKMTVVELADLVKAMEEKFGISAAAPMAAGGAAGAAAEEVKDSFTVSHLDPGKFLLLAIS